MYIHSTVDACRMPEPDRVLLPNDHKYSEKILSKTALLQHHAHVPVPFPTTSCTKLLRSRCAESCAETSCRSGGASGASRPPRRPRTRAMPRPREGGRDGRDGGRKAAVGGEVIGMGMMGRDVEGILWMFSGCTRVWRQLP